MKGIDRVDPGIPVVSLSVLAGGDCTRYFQLIFSINYRIEDSGATISIHVVLPGRIFYMLSTTSSKYHRLCVARNTREIPGTHSHKKSPLYNYRRTIFSWQS